MAHLSSPSVPSSDAGILIEAARCWRKARDAGQPVQPSLARHLAERGHAMLAPVLDSLIRFYESALRRPMIAGEAMILSADETHLLGMLRDPRTCTVPDCPDAAARGLRCALCSTRIMLAMGGMPAMPGQRPCAG